jgi:tetratricopeptide (TPR) repeat protein
MLARLDPTPDRWDAENALRVALLGPEGIPPADAARLLERMTADPRAEERTYLWYQLTRAHAACRTGDGAGAVRLLTDSPSPLGRGDKMDATALAVLAAARLRAGQPAEARDALVRARALLAALDRLPTSGVPAADNDWADLVHCRVLIRRAEEVIPPAPATAAAAGSAFAAEAARRDRKDRADRSATEFALALIRVDNGRPADAEPVLRRVLDGRARLAAEEPGNFEYRAAEADTRIALGRVLIAAGEIDEGLAEVRRGLVFHALLEQWWPDADTRRARATVAATLVEVGAALVAAGRHGDGGPMAREGLDLAGRVSGAWPGGQAAGSAARISGELTALYALHGLWPEAADLLGPGGLYRSPGADADAWLATARALILTGRSGTLRAMLPQAGDLFKKSPPADTYPLVVIAGLTGQSAELGVTPAVRAKVLADRWNDPAAQVWAAVYDYRTRRYDQAVAALSDPRYRNSARAKAVAAMATYRLGREAEARERLAEAVAVYAARSRELAFAGTAFGPLADPGEDADDLILLREAHRIVTGRALPPDPFAALARARALFLLGDPGTAEAELRAAVEPALDDPEVWLARAWVWKEQGRVWRAAADLAEARRVAIAGVLTRPLDPVAVVRLAATLASRPYPVWTTVRPVGQVSAGGATLTLREDGSVVAAGASPDRDVYTLEFEIDGPVAAFRLEALTDPALAGRGPGRSSNGNFHVCDFRVEVHPAAGVGPPAPVVWARAFGSYEQQNGLPFRHAADGDPDTGWGIDGRQGRPHWGVFVPETPVGKAGRVRVTVRIVTGDPAWPRTTLGRFRMSVAR